MNTIIGSVAVALCGVVLALAMAAGTALAMTSPIGAQPPKFEDRASQVFKYGDGSSRTTGTSPVHGAKPGRGRPCGSAPKRNSPPPPNGPRGNRPESPSAPSPVLNSPQSAPESSGFGPVAGATADSTEVPLGPTRRHAP